MLPHSVSKPSLEKHVSLEGVEGMRGQMLNLRKRHDEVVDVSVLASFDDALVGNVFFVCAEKHVFFDRASVQCRFLRHEGQMFSVLSDVEA